MMDCVHELSPFSVLACVIVLGIYLNLLVEIMVRF